MSDSEHQCKRIRGADPAAAFIAADESSSTMKGDVVISRLEALVHQRLWADVYASLSSAEEMVLASVAFTHVCYIAQKLAGEWVQSEVGEMSYNTDCTPRFSAAVQRALRPDSRPQFDMSMLVLSCFVQLLPVRTLTRRKAAVTFDLGSFWTRLQRGHDRQPYCCFVAARQFRDSEGFYYQDSDAGTIRVRVDINGTCGCKAFCGMYTCLYCGLVEGALVVITKGSLQCTSSFTEVLVLPGDVQALPDIVLPSTLITQLYLPCPSLQSGSPTWLSSLIHTEEYLACIEYISSGPVAIHNSDNNTTSSEISQSKQFIQSSWTQSCIAAPHLLQFVYSIPLYSSPHVQARVEHSSSLVERCSIPSNDLISVTITQESNVLIQYSESQGSLIIQFADSLEVRLLVQCSCMPSETCTQQLQGGVYCSQAKYSMVVYNNRFVLYCLVKDTDVIFTRKYTSSIDETTQMNHLPSLYGLQQAVAYAQRYCLLGRSDFLVISYRFLHEYTILVCAGESSPVITINKGHWVPNTSLVRLHGSNTIGVLEGVSVQLCSRIQALPSPAPLKQHRWLVMSVHSGFMQDHNIVLPRSVSSRVTQLLTMELSAHSVVVFRGESMQPARPELVIWLCGQGPVPITGTLLLNNQIAQAEPVLLLHDGNLQDHAVFIGGDWCNFEMQRIELAEYKTCLRSQFGCLSRTEQFPLLPSDQSLGQTLSLCFKNQDLIIQSFKAHYLYRLSRLPYRTNSRFTALPFEPILPAIPEVLPSSSVVDWMETRITEMHHAMFWIECSFCGGLWLNSTTSVTMCAGCSRSITHCLLESDSDCSMVVKLDGTSCTLAKEISARGGHAGFLRCCQWATLASATSGAALPTVLHSKQLPNLLAWLPLCRQQLYCVCAQILKADGVPFQYNRAAFLRLFYTFSSDITSTLQPELASVPSPPTHRNQPLSAAEFDALLALSSVSSVLDRPFSDLSSENRAIGHSLRVWEDSFRYSIHGYTLAPQYTRLQPLFQHTHVFSDGPKQKAFQQRRAADFFAQQRTDLSLLHTQSLEYRCSIQVRVFEEPDDIHCRASLLQASRRFGFQVLTRLDVPPVAGRNLRRQVVSQTQTYLLSLNEQTQRSLEPSE